MNVAITGGIGSGKSSVANYLVEKTKSAYCDTDIYCKEILEKGQTGWKAVKAKWGQRFLKSDGLINRPLLRKTIFNDKKVKRDLEDMLHPHVMEYVEIYMEECLNNGQMLIVEVPLLFEVGWQEKFDKTLTVFANTEQCIKRVMNRDGVIADEVEMAIKAQIPLADKVKLSDYVIDNSGSWEATCRHVDKLVRILKN